ncbi:YdeI/OmpD-associated family protein [Micromonospora sp. NPDC049523]|uniref:YdeI/OmpD-associated family protein n=1 Tax=Micromonospora sp. NPDC049523 TaxID=3155921 RepID=UPI003442B9FE
MSPDQPELTVADQDAWREWLDAHHGDSDGVWLLLAKQGSTDPTSLTYAQALEEALCYGWIDSQARSRDETTYTQRFSPRRSTSPWSARNVTRVSALVEAGRMRPAGTAEIERAKADGRWDAAYAGPATAEVPADLAAALDAEPRARAMFDILTKQNSFAIVYRVGSAKKAETRARRIAQFVEMLTRGETIYPQKRRLED